MTKKIVRFIRKRSELEKTLFGITVSIVSFTVYDAGYDWGIVFPFLIVMYILLHALFHDTIAKHFQKGRV